MSFSSSLVGILGFHPDIHVFVFVQKTLCDLFLLFFLYCLGMVKEERGGRGGQGEDAWSTCIKFDNVLIQLRIIIKLPVNPNITLYILSIQGVGSPSKASSLIKPKSKSTWVL